MNTYQGLGDRQRSVLRALVRHGGYPSGWYWTSHRVTVQILDTLVKRGLVETNGHKYTITDAGRKLVS